MNPIVATRSETPLRQWVRQRLILALVLMTLATACLAAALWVERTAPVRGSRSMLTGYAGALHMAVYQLDEIATAPEAGLTHYRRSHLRYLSGQLDVYLSLARNTDLGRELFIDQANSSPEYISWLDPMQTKFDALLVDGELSGEQAAAIAGVYRKLASLIDHELGKCDEGSWYCESTSNEDIADAARQAVLTLYPGSTP